MRRVGWNKQRNNPNFNNVFSGSKQCFGTSGWMFMSFFAPDKYKYDDDQMLSQYIDDVTNIVGKPGIAEELKGKNYKSNTEYEWLVEKAGIEKWLHNAGVQGKIVYNYTTNEAPTNTWDDIKNALKISPVIIGTTKMGGLPGGHIILLTDCEGDNFQVNDPYGNALTNYVDQNGEAVIYSLEYLKKFTYSPTLVRAMWWQK